MRSHDDLATHSLHSLHECRNAEDFCSRFEASTGRDVAYVIGQIVAATAPQATFLTGSIPLGMATNGSDVDFVVLVDSREALVRPEVAAIANTPQRLAFSNESDPLRAGLFLTEMSGTTVEVAVVITPNIQRVYGRLRSRGPELSENEIMTLSRLKTGWLIAQSGGYLEQRAVALTDPALEVYCSTRHFAYALMYRKKAAKALELADIPQALHLGRLSVEAAYLAYFASEGYSYLGAKWLAQIGHAHGAASRVSRHPMLKQNVQLMFPSCESSSTDALRYLHAVKEFLVAMRNLIEQKILFRIAFKACPQI